MSQNKNAIEYVARSMWADMASDAEHPLEVVAAWYELPDKSMWLGQAEVALKAASEFLLGRAVSPPRDIDSLADLIHEVNHTQGNESLTPDGAEDIARAILELSHDR